MKRGTPRHRKMRRLADLLGVELAHAVGIMEMIWHSAGQETPRGDIGTAKDREIAAWCDWRKKPVALVEALVEAHWLDRHEEYRLIVHDWPEHAEQAVKKWLERRKESFLECYAEKPPRVRTASGQESDEDQPNGSPRERARALASAGAEASVPPDSEANSETRAPATKRTAVTDPDWGKFIAEAKANGVDGSGEDWRRAEFEWRQLDFNQRLAAFSGLSKDHTGKTGSLIHNYLKNRIWERPIRQPLESNQRHPREQSTINAASDFWRA